MFFKKNKKDMQFEDICRILDERAKNQMYKTTLLEIINKNNWTKTKFEQNYDNLAILCDCIQKENEILATLNNQICPIDSKESETKTIKNLKEVLGIDLGTYKSTIGVYRINSRGRVDIDIISNQQGERSTPSVVCLYNDKMYFGKEAMKVSLKCPQNLIYDTKRMLGRKFDDPFIQKMRKYWTFKTVRSKDGGILIEVDGFQYEPYEISGMILNFLMNLANSRLREPINHAIVTIPAYFTEKQKEETRKAAEAAGLKLLELIEEPKAAAYCYGYKSNDMKNESKDIFIYDIGGGTLDVSYVEMKGSSFKVLATSGDSFLGGQDFTNRLFDFVSPYLDKICNKTWKSEPRFVSYVKDQCDKAKMYLTDSEDYDFYFEIPTKLQKTKEMSLEINITREKFEQISKDLFEKCMIPVKDVLKRVQRDPKQINGLILIGGSSFLPKIRKQLKEITEKDAYHDVSPIEAVAFGACATSIKYCEKSINEIAKGDNNSKFLTQFSVKEVAPATIEIVKIKDKTKYYFTMIEEGSPLPFAKETLIYSSDVEYKKNSKEIVIPVFAKKGEKRTLLGNIKYEVHQKSSYSGNIPLVKIKLRQIVSNLFYSTNNPSTEFWSCEKKLEDDNITDSENNDETKSFNKASYHQNVSKPSSALEETKIQKKPIGPPPSGKNSQTQQPSGRNFQKQPLVIQEANFQKRSPVVIEANTQKQALIINGTNFQRQVQTAPEKSLQKQEIPIQNQIYQTQKIQKMNYQHQNYGLRNQAAENQNQSTETQRQLIANQKSKTWSNEQYPNNNSQQQYYPIIYTTNQSQNYQNTMFHQNQPSAPNPTFFGYPISPSLGYQQETFHNYNQQNNYYNNQYIQENQPIFSAPPNEKIQYKQYYKL